MTSVADVGRVASFPMYDLVELRDAHAELWRSVAARLADAGLAAPEQLTHDDDVHALWHDPAMLVSQACGWPLVTELVGVADVIGAFEYDVPDADGPTYHSHLVAPAGHPLPDAAELADVTVAVNGTDSLSGWISLVRSFPLAIDEWPGAVEITGAHVRSLDALRAGHADLACIDAVTWALLADVRPSAIEGVEIVGRAPQIPCLPIIVAASALLAERGVIADAIREAVADAHAAAVALRIVRFHPLTDDAYAHLLHR